MVQVLELGFNGQLTLDRLLGLSESEFIYLYNPDPSQKVTIVMEQNRTVPGT